MKNKKIMIVVSLIIVIVLLCIGIWVTNQHYTELKLDQFITQFERLSKQDDKIYPLKKYTKEQTDGKVTYEFQDGFYMRVSYDTNQIVEKAYYSIKRDGNELELMRKYLPILIATMNPKLSNQEIENIVKRLTDITGQKADEFGFLVEFEEQGSSYMTLEKENGTYLSFFIYVLAE